MSQDVIITWDFALNKQARAALQNAFTRPVKVISLPTPAGKAYGAQLEAMGWPHPVRKILLDAGVTDPGRVATFGFSESCGGPGKLLASADAAFIDFAFACDGIHTSWTTGKASATRDNIVPGALLQWSDFAKLCASGPRAVAGLPPSSRALVITHSSIDPISYASTSDTARIILERVYGRPPEWPQDADFSWAIDASRYPVDIAGNSINGFRKTHYEQPPVYYWAGSGGLQCVGYHNMDPSGVNDHILQAQVVLPQTLASVLVPRWNSVDPDLPSCTSAGTSGPQCNATAPLKFPMDGRDGTVVTSPGGSSASTATSGAKAAKANPAVAAVQVAGVLLAGYGLWRGYKALRGRRW